MLPPCSRSWLWQYPCWHRVCPAARWFCFPTRPEPIRFSVRYGCWVPPSSPKQNRNQRGTAPYFSLESVSLHPLWRPTDYTHCLNRSVSAGFRRLPVSCLSCYPGKGTHGNADSDAEKTLLRTGVADRKDPHYAPRYPSPSHPAVCSPKRQEYGGGRTVPGESHTQHLYICPLDIL